MVQHAANVKGDRNEAGRLISHGARFSVEQRLSHALVHGVLDFIEADVEEARRQYTDGRSRSSKVR